jgi:hypothetical protein
VNELNYFWKTGSLGSELDGDTLPSIITDPCLMLENARTPNPPPIPKHKALIKEKI